MYTRRCKRTHERTHFIWTALTNETIMTLTITVVMLLITLSIVMIFSITGFLPLRVPAGTSTKISITWRSTLGDGLGEKDGDFEKHDEGAHSGTN